MQSSLPNEISDTSRLALGNEIHNASKLTIVISTCKTERIGFVIIGLSAFDFVQ